MTTVVKIGTEFQINSQTTGGQWYPSVTGLANGGFVVTWQDGLAGYNGSGSSSLGDTSGSSVKAQLYAADGSKVGGEFLVNTQTTGSQATPVVTGLSNGGFVVSWQDQNSTSGDIRAQIYSASGTPVGGEISINAVTANNQNMPAITGLPNGGFVVAWTNQGSSAPDVKAQVYDANGVKVGSEFLVNSSNVYDQERTSIATLSNGDFVVTWNDFRTGNWEVRGQVFHPTASGATKVGSEFTVDQAYYNNRMVAGVTGLANGNFVISFEDTSGEVRAQVFTAAGTKVGSEFQVNTQTGGNQGFSSITALTGGGFVVTWSDEGIADGNGSGIKAQVYDAAGVKVGGEYVVNSQTASYQYYPTVAALANGGFVISWQDFSQTLGDNSSYGITAQVFNVANAPTAPTIVSVTDDVSPNTGVIGNGASTNDTNLTVRIATGSNFAGDVIQLFDGQTALGTGVTLTLADVARGYIDLQTGVLGNATHAITAKVTDTTGATSDAATMVNVTVDTVAPAVAIGGVSLNTGSLPSFTVSGITEPGLQVTVYDGATLIGTTVAGNDGSWSLAGVTLVEGANGLTAKTTDLAGNVGGSLVFVAPTLVSTAPVSVNSASTTSMGYVVLGSGVLDVVSGGNVSGQITIGNGGVVVLNGGTTQHTEILNGGVQYDYGNASDTIVRAGGQQHVYFGGKADGTTVEAGGYQDVYSSSTVTNVTLKGQQQVLAGGSAIDTTVTSGGYQYVGNGGHTERTVIETGGLQYVDTGATTDDTVINGGFQFVNGSSTGGSIGGGQSQTGGIATNVTVKNGGAQHVYNGGNASGTTIEAGAFQDVYHGAVTGTILSGSQQVLEGATADQTVIQSGGNAYVGNGGSVSATTVNAGGLLYVDTGATASGTTIDGGFAWVAGTASNTTLNGGELDVTGSASGTHLAGGVERVLAGGVQNGVDFAGSAATLKLENADGLSGTVSNFEVGDMIDLLNTSVSSFTFDGSTLTLVTNAGTHAYQFAGVQSGTELNVADDGHGGTAISLSLLVQQSASLVPDAGTESSFVAQDTNQQQTTLVSHG
ncbi:MULTISPECIES: AIDA repeat-containing protein [unclassified Bradyrhizobium]|uniref:AIDA repeat-containing protein n=1 Tax=unclassified Bradyrhizobium TaxID=2631580 RepID=UPI00070EA3C6|nr:MULTISPECIES: AIDA repeat-containing protein [unclassified Bradyrhizobium]KQT03050.1 hypothetical protein ASG57_15865 [Bradyrhizobium sp. Leaf396]